MAEMEDKTSSNDFVETETEETASNEAEEYLPKDEYSYEEVVAMEARLKKAEKALVERKKAEKASKQKAEEVSTPSEANYITKQDLAFDKFLDKYPEMEEYKEDIKKHLSKGLSLAEAKLLIDNSPALVNRDKIKKTSISYSEGGAQKTTYTRADLENMSQKEYANIRRQADDGKVVIKG